MEEPPNTSPVQQAEMDTLVGEFSNLASIDVDDIIHTLPSVTSIAIKESTRVNKLPTASYHHQLRDLLHFSSIGMAIFLFFFFFLLRSQLLLSFLFVVGFFLLFLFE
jgi:hypothetical protein